MNMSVLAKKYAQAYLHVFKDACVVENIQPLKQLISFFSEHKKVLFFLGVSAINYEEKKKVIMMLAKQVGFIGSIDTIFALLIRQRRSFLIPEVCYQMGELILMYYGLLACTIATAHPLLEEEKNKLKAFFMYKVGSAIIPEYVIDKTLIAGIALRSTTYSWEYSIRKNIHNVNQRLIT